MAQTREGSIKIFCNRVGIATDFYYNQTDNGFKWCSKCKSWISKLNFNKDNSRYDGLCSICMDCSHVKERAVIKGRVSAFKGKTHSDESRLLMSIARKGNNNRLGVSCTDAQRLRISEGTKIHALRGADNPNWKGGITPKNILARHSFEYREWRRMVFERDNFTCQHCGDSKGGNLHPHHIKYFSEYLELRYSVSNGITLCKTCHEIVHGRKL